MNANLPAQSLRPCTETMRLFDFFCEKIKERGYNTDGPMVAAQLTNAAATLLADERKSARRYEEWSGG